MDALTEFLEDLKQQGLAQGHFLGLLNLLVGRTITRADGTLISGGLTWRTLAAVLKKVRWSRESVRELGLDPDDLPPRDRQHFWYSAISRARIDSAKAREEGDRLAAILAANGYVVAPAPGK
jgi:hypothetical protein